MSHHALLFPDQITVDREERQRKEIKPEDVESLAASIARVGLINDIIVDANNKLVAGETRFAALLHLGWTQIPVKYSESMEPNELFLLEFEENAKRRDLDWRETNDAVMRYHAMAVETEKDWSFAKTGECLGLSQASMSRHKAVFEARASGVTGVEEAEKWSTAANITQRYQERKRASTLLDLNDQVAEQSEETFVKTVSDDGKIISEVPALPPRRADIMHDDFTAWAKQSHLNLYNFVHCDFPYGIGTGDKKGQSGAKNRGTYDDSEDVYWTLLKTFGEHQDNFIAPSAHLMFWFSMKFYSDTVRLLKEFGWSVNPMPLIWGKSDNTGIIPDTNRGPRQIYETAILASRGDRKIVSPVANCFWGPTTKKFHTSEKSFAMLSHFFRMLVDDTTRMVDPTCGSGMAVRAAEEAGASFALGLERDIDFFAGACENLGLYGPNHIGRDHTGGTL